MKEEIIIEEETKNTEEPVNEGAVSAIGRRGFLIRLNRILGVLLGAPLVYPLLRYLGHGRYPGMDNTWISLGQVDQFKEYDKPELVKFTRVKEDAYTIQELPKSHWVVRFSKERLMEIYKNGAGEFRDVDGKVFWKNTPDAEFVVFSGKCTHLGCSFRWREAKGVFFCPCHLGIFKITGEVVDGPPPRRLDQLPVRIKDSRLEVVDAEFKAGKKIQVRLV